MTLPSANLDQKLKKAKQLDTQLYGEVLSFHSILT